MPSGPSTPGSAALGPLLEDVAFVDGATLVLWLDEPGAPE